MAYEEARLSISFKSMGVCCNSKAIFCPFGDQAMTSARRSPESVLTSNSTSPFNPRLVRALATRRFASKCARVSPVAHEQSVGGLCAKWSMTFRPFFNIAIPLHFGHRYSGPRCATTASILTLSRLATSIAITFRRIALLFNVTYCDAFASSYGTASTSLIEKATDRACIRSTATARTGGMPVPARRISDQWQLFPNPFNLYVGKRVERRGRSTLRERLARHRGQVGSRCVPNGQASRTISSWMGVVTQGPRSGSR